MRRAGGVLALALCLTASAAAAQTMGPVTVNAGLGMSAQTERQFWAVGPHLWGAMETVFDRQLRVRFDGSLHHFGYRGPTGSPACVGRDFCARPLTSDLDLIAVTATVVWRDTTMARRWYGFAGLGAYGTLHLRDANSRVGLTGGAGAHLGGRWFIEARTHLAYDATGHRGLVFPLKIGRRVGRFTP